MRLLSPLKAALTAVAVLAASLVVLAPAATAHHTCSTNAFVDTPLAAAGTYGGDCVGAWESRILLPCSHTVWGYHSDEWGVGGMMGCEVGAYVQPAWAVATARGLLLP